MKQLLRNWHLCGMYRRRVRLSDRNGRNVRTRTIQVRTSQVRTSQVRTSQVRTSQVRTSRVRTSQVRTSLASISQKRTGIFVKTEEGGQRAKARSAVLRRTML